MGRKRQIAGRCFVYALEDSETNTVFYVGVTSNLKNGAWGIETIQHRQPIKESATF